MWKDKLPANSPDFLALCEAVDYFSTTKLTLENLIDSTSRQETVNISNAKCYKTCVKTQDQERILLWRKAAVVYALTNGVNATLTRI